jgi:hypothetical protein
MESAAAPEYFNISRRVGASTPDALFFFGIKILPFISKYLHLKRISLKDEESRYRKKNAGKFYSLLITLTINHWG